MTLKAKLMELNSIDTSWGYWADAPFTADSDCRVGQTQFDNGGLLDDMQFVGSLNELSVYYAAPMVCVRWGYTEASVSTTDGWEDLFTLEPPTDVLNPAANAIEEAEAKSLYQKYIAPMLTDFGEDYKHLVSSADANALQAWLADVRSAVDFGADADSLIIASESGDTIADALGWVELYVEPRDGFDETAFREAEAERLIDWAEERRQELVQIHDEKLAALERQEAAELEAEQKRLLAKAVCQLASFRPAV